MEIRSIIIVFLWFTHPHLLLSQEQGCSVVVSRNSTDPTEVAFRNYVDGFLKEKKITKPVSASLNTGQINVSMIFAVDYNGTKVTVKLKDIILKTDSNSSDPNFFIDKYNVNKNKALIELKKLLNDQNITYIIDDTMLSDKTLNAYVQKIIKFKALVNVHSTVTSEVIYTDFIEIQYVGKEGCFLSFDYNDNQRHKRSTNSMKQDQKSRVRLFINKMKPSEQHSKDSEYKSVVKRRLSPRSISANDECSSKRVLPTNAENPVYPVYYADKRAMRPGGDYSNKRSGSTIKDVNDDYHMNSDNFELSRSVIPNYSGYVNTMQGVLNMSIPKKRKSFGKRLQMILHYPVQDIQQIPVITDTGENPAGNRSIFSIITDFILKLAGKFVKFLFCKIKNLIFKYIGLQKSDRNFRRNVFDPKHFLAEYLRNKALPNIHTYLEKTGKEIVTSLLDDFQKNNKFSNKSFISLA